jgi:hypothetical protein
MAKVQMTPRALLRIIRQGVANGQTDAVLAVIDEAIPQLPDEGVQTADPTAVVQAHVEWALSQVLDDYNCIDLTYTTDRSEAVDGCDFEKVAERLTHYLNQERPS